MKAIETPTTLRASLRRTLRRWAVIALVLAPATAILLTAPEPTVKGSRASSAERCEPDPLNNWCAPQGDPRVAREVTRQEAAGLSCSTVPVLTDAVIFQIENLETRVVSFDEAIELGKSGRGWVQAYCV